MKHCVKKIMLALSILLLFAMLFSCNNGLSSDGASTIRLKIDPSRAMVNGMEYDRYFVVCRGPGSSYVSLNIKNTSASITDIVGGDWSITVQAFSGDSLEAEGSQTVTVPENGSIDLEIQLELLNPTPTSTFTPTATSTATATQTGTIVPTPTYPAVQLYNPGAENGTTGWTGDGIADDVEVKSGNYSFLLKHGNTLSQSPLIAPGTTCNLSAWVYLENTDTTLKLTASDRDGNVVLTLVANSNAKNWQELSGSFTSGVYQSYTITMQSEGRWNWIYVDDLSLSADAQPSPTTTIAPTATFTSTPPPTVSPTVFPTTTVSPSPTPTFTQTATATATSTATATFTPTSTFTQNTPSALPLQAGLSFPTDYHPGIPMIDAVKFARDWSVCSVDSINWSGRLVGVEIPTDRDGYPYQLPNVPEVAEPVRLRSIMLTDLPIEVYPLGTYTLMFEGSGHIRIEFLWNSSYDLTDRVIADVDSTNGTVHKFNVDTFPGKKDAPNTSRGMVISILRSDVNNPLKNLRLIIPDQNGGDSYCDIVPEYGLPYYEVQPFNPLYVEDLRVFQTIRFMDWCRANMTKEAYWNSRARKTSLYNGHPKLGDWATKERPVAWEYMIELCNITGNNLWVNIPTNSFEDKDTYWPELAKLIRDNLNAELKVYVEYGNENWNGMFEGYDYTLAKAAELKAQGYNWPTKPDGTYSDIYAAWSFDTYCSLELQRVFEGILGADRVTGMISVQNRNYAVIDHMVRSLDSPVVNPYNVQIDAIASTMYFGLSGAFAGSEEASHWNYNKAKADSIGALYIGYEGGTNSDNMSTNYTTYKQQYQFFQGIFDNISQFCFINTNNGENWLAMNYAGQPLADAHKFRAIYEYAVDTGWHDPNAYYNPLDNATPIDVVADPDWTPTPTATATATATASPSASPSPTESPTPEIKYIEAENADVSNDCNAVTSGSVTYMDYGSAGAYLEFDYIYVDGMGDHTVDVIYANGDTVNRPCDVYINGNLAGTINFAPTGGWDNWGTVSLDMHFSMEGNLIQIIQTGSKGPNVDKIGVHGGL